MRLMLACALLLSCASPTSEDLAAKQRGSDATCVTEKSAEYGSVTFCVDDRRLLLCTHDEGCITVPLGRCP